MARSPLDAPKDNPTSKKNLSRIRPCFTVINVADATVKEFIVADATVEECRVERIQDRRGDEEER